MSKVIYHGGCHSCDSQEAYGLERCNGCQYRDADWSKPDLQVRWAGKYDWHDGTVVVRLMKRPNWFRRFWMWALFGARWIDA